MNGEQIHRRMTKGDGLRFRWDKSEAFQHFDDYSFEEWGDQEYVLYLNISDNHYYLTMESFNNAKIEDNEFIFTLNHRHYEEREVRIDLLISYSRLMGAIDNMGE